MGLQRSRAVVLFAVPCFVLGLADSVLLIAPESKAQVVSTQPRALSSTTQQSPGVAEVWAEVDVNRSGALDASEMARLAEAVLELATAERAVVSPLDRLADANKDGRLERAEGQRAVRRLLQGSDAERLSASVNSYVVPSSRQTPEVDVLIESLTAANNEPGRLLAGRRDFQVEVDVNQDGRLDPAEIKGWQVRTVIGRLQGPTNLQAGMIGQAGFIGDRYSGMDSNQNGVIDAEEFKVYLARTVIGQRVVPK
mgnify:FL=1